MSALLRFGTPKKRACTPCSFCWSLFHLGSGSAPPGLSCLVLGGMGSRLRGHGLGRVVRGTVGRDRNCRFTRGPGVGSAEAQTRASARQRIGHQHSGHRSRVLTHSSPPTGSAQERARVRSRHTGGHIFPGWDWTPGSAIAGYHHSDVIFSIVAIWPLGIVIGLTLLGRLRQRSSLQLLAIIAVPDLLLVASGLAAQGRSPPRSFISSRRSSPLPCSGRSRLVRYANCGGKTDLHLAAARDLHSGYGGTAVRECHSRLDGSAWALAQINARSTARNEMIFVPSFLTAQLLTLPRESRPSPRCPAYRGARERSEFRHRSFSLIRRGSRRTTSGRGRSGTAGPAGPLKVIHAENVTVWEFA